MADPPLKHDRDFQAFRNAYGVKDPDWPERSALESRIRATVNVDDTSHLVRPAPVRFGLYDISQPATVGLIGIAQATIRSPGGAYVTLYSTSTVYYTTESLVAFVQTGVDTPEVLGNPGGAPLSLVESGTTVGVPVGILTPQFGDTRSLYLQPGTVLQVALKLANTAWNAGLSIQEIP